MKKGIFIVLLAVIISINLFGKESSVQIEAIKKYSVEQLFSTFSEEKKSVHVNLGGFTMLLVKLFTDTKGVSGVEVYSFDECEHSVKQRFNDAIKNLKDNSYETLVSTSENGERTKILVKIKEDHINEIVVIAGGDDPVLVRIKGKIKPDDVKSVIEKNK